MGTRIGNREDLDCLRSALRVKREAATRTVAVCGGTGCRAQSSADIRDAIAAELKRAGISDTTDLKMSGCHGLCEMGPIVLISPGDIFCVKVKPEDARDIVEHAVVDGNPVERLRYQDKMGRSYSTFADIPFYRHQQRLVLGLNGYIDPADIEDYIVRDGYSALAKVLGEYTPDDVIGLITESGLRGRGGGGFLTGRKWAICRNAASGDGVRYVICNADEGDPGAFMDRSIMEGNPHRVLEGMLIGAYAIGSAQGYVYVRSEYPLAVEHMQKAIADARGCGLLGKDILRAGFEFDIQISKGAGAFVCGESTALMASLEGRVGRPRAKYIHTVERGLWDKPSALNNVETWANVPLIVNRGADWYAEIGTKDSKGTKIFSLVGKINNTGLVEVPMGVSLREIVFDIGGGIPNGKRFKAVQTGGPSGGCIPEALLDLPIDFDELSSAGSMMGSGGMIVMDEDTCMVDIARYFIDFLREESCGKCVACREGITRMLEILQRICAGAGQDDDLQTLTEIGEYLSDTALCALGTTAANPVLSTLRYFREEYVCHIREKYCPAGVCKRLFCYAIDAEACKGCGACRKECPAGAIAGGKKEPHSIDPARCIRCGVCFDTCRFESVNKVRGTEVAV